MGFGDGGCRVMSLNPSILLNRSLKAQPEAMHLGARSQRWKKAASTCRRSGVGHLSGVWEGFGIAWIRLRGRRVMAMGWILRLRKFLVSKG